ncbi:elongation factor P [Altererythrobacter salegens]|uniref:Elongation factor P n=1 Tax=Croceibacterium salegens TaxID=1737568 RepID=A0A6I4SUE1_9SPHN|nr:elongation factor P [Croceibacterium salegens]MXO58717.1 elongation factor P [Croceibacterium salegens]
MRRSVRTIPAIIAVLAAAPLSAAGPVETAMRGSYSCEMPGTAAGAAGIRVPEKDFRIRSASRYKSEQGNGVYLRKGDVIRFTSGPRSGESYTVVGENFLRALGPDGKPSRLRCIRTGN